MKIYKGTSTLYIKSNPTSVLCASLAETIIKSKEAICQITNMMTIDPMIHTKVVIKNSLIGFLFPLNWP